MILSDKDIIKLLQEPRNGKSIASGAKLQADHKVHITGEGYEALVRQVEGYESSDDFNIKKQVSKPATILITSTIIDNLNRWTSAQGTVKKTDFRDPGKNEEFQKVLSQVWHGKSYEDFVNSFQKEAIYTEFNGFVLVTKPAIKKKTNSQGEEYTVSDREGIENEYNGTDPLNPYMIFISITDIQDFYLTGDRVEYLIIKLDENKKRFRVIDDEKDIIINFQNNESTTPESSIPNELGYVPARKISNINEKLLNNQIKTSPIQHLIPSLDRYFSCDADLRMSLIKHNYAKLITVTRECKACQGQGYQMDMETRIKCDTCDGSGKEIPIRRDGVIGIPQYLKQGDTPYPGSPASYVTPEVESFKIADADLEKQKAAILYAGTGDKALVDENFKTATENMINSRSLEDRISEISTMVEEFEMFIKTCIKGLHKIFAPIADYEIVVKYGKKITLKNEADLLVEIKDAKNSGLNFSFIQALQVDLIYTRYKNNKSELERQLLLNDIEPFAGYSIDEIFKFESYITDEDLKLKVNFKSLIDQYESKQSIQNVYEGLSYKEKVTRIKADLYELLPEEEEKPTEEIPEEINPFIEPLNKMKK